MRSYFAFYVNGSGTPKTPINQFDSDARAIHYYTAIKPKTLWAVMCIEEGQSQPRTVYRSKICRQPLSLQSCH